MFQDLRPRNGPFLGHMTDEKCWCSGTLGPRHELRSHFSNLPNASGGRGERFRVDGLNGIEDYHVGLEVLQVLEKVLQAGACKDKEVFRRDGKALGPVPHSHAVGLPKKVRALALKHALSSKVKSEELIILDKAELKEAKTKALKDKFAALGLQSALIIDGAQVDQNFALAARNIPHIDVLTFASLNVYDILRRQKLVLTKAALEALEERFK